MFVCFDCRIDDFTVKKKNVQKICGENTPNPIKNNDSGETQNIYDKYVNKLKVMIIVTIIIKNLMTKYMI